MTYITFNYCSLMQNWRLPELKHYIIYLSIAEKKRNSHSHWPLLQMPFHMCILYALVHCPSTLGEVNCIRSIFCDYCQCCLVTGTADIPPKKCHINYSINMYWFCNTIGRHYTVTIKNASFLLLRPEFRIDYTDTEGNRSTERHFHLKQTSCHKLQYWFLIRIPKTPKSPTFVGFKM